jgi:hypothetical protein
VHLDKVLNDRQTETQPRVRARRPRRRLAKTLEQVRQERGRDALAAIGDGDDTVAGFFGQTHRDGRTLRAELHGVRE